MIIFTSFEKSKFFQWEGNIKTTDKCYSIARWQPHGFHYHPLPFLAPTMEGFKFTSEPPETQREAFIKHCIAYEDALFAQYQKDLRHIKDWLSGLKTDKDYFLCCWCPFSKSAEWQLRFFKGFFCHSYFVGKLINKHAPHLEVKFYPSTDYTDDKGRSKIFGSFKKKKRRMGGDK